MGRGRRHQDAARQIMAVRQCPLHDDAAHRVADQNRRAGAAFGRLENVTDIIVDAEVMEAVAPFAPAMSAAGRSHAPRSPRAANHGRNFSAQIQAPQKAPWTNRSGTGLAGPVGE